jgi:hypothetical protein
MPEIIKKKIKYLLIIEGASQNVAKVANLKNFVPIFKDPFLGWQHLIRSNIFKMHLILNTTFCNLYEYIYFRS